MCHYFRIKLGRDTQEEESGKGVGGGKKRKGTVDKKKKGREKSNL